MMIGTTLLGIQTHDYVIIATDSQIFLDQIIKNRSVQKIYSINDFTVCCTLGSIADTQFIVENLQIIINNTFNENNEYMNVRMTVQIIRDFLYKEKRVY